MGHKRTEIDEYIEALEHAFAMDNEEDEEGVEEDCNAVAVEEEEEEDNGRGDEEEAEEEEEDKEEKNCRESTEAGGSGIQSHYQQFQGLNYEALANKKRKTLADFNGSGKKARQDDMSGASMHERMEMENYGMRRKSKKNKKRGRRKGSKSKHSLEIERMLGDAVVHHAHGRYEEAISLLNEVVRLEPGGPHSYHTCHTLGLAHGALGDTQKAMKFFEIAARLNPKSSLWKELFTWHLKQGDKAKARECMSKAMRADPSDIDLKSSSASLYVELGDYLRAAELYAQIVKICPQKVQELLAAAKCYLKSGQIEQGVDILEDYLKDHPSDANPIVIDFLASTFMEINAYNNALQRIEHAQLVYYTRKGLPLQLKVKAGICHIHLGNVKKAEILFNVHWETVSNHTILITEVADAYMSCEYFQSALKYYHMLEPLAGIDNEGSIHFKIAQCYSFLKDRAKAIEFFYKALNIVQDGVDTRLALASLLLEEAKEDDAIFLLSPPKKLENLDPISDTQKLWWLDAKIKLKLCYIHRAKGMMEDFVNTIFPLVHDSLCVKTLQRKVKKRLTENVLRKRAEILDVRVNADVFGGVRPFASRSDLAKAARARKLLQKKEEQKAAARTAGCDWSSDDTDDDCLEEDVRAPPLPNFLEDEEHHNLIIDLCKALQSLKRYSEALKIISLTRRLARDRLSVEKEEELQSIVAQILHNTTDPKHGFDDVRDIVQQHPYSNSAWNCYYKIALRLPKGYSKHGKFLHIMRARHSDCVPPILISGHQFTISFYQDAAKEYVKAYKLFPDSPLINLCVGTALINLALGFRLQNKHQCVAEGLAFLYNNLRFAENGQLLQEALYNVARAFHHVGLVSLAASYYEKVLATCVKDYPIPKLLNESSHLQENLKPGYCDLRREAAYNLHLIYRKSGAVDLARQVLKDHCTF